MTRKFKDLLILLGVAAIAVLIGAVARQFLPAPVELPLGIGLLFAAAAAVKWRWPNHHYMSRITWTHFVAAAAIFTAVAVILGDWTLLRYWTVPAAIVLGLIYCVINVALTSPKRR